MESRPTTCIYLNVRQSFIRKPKSITRPSHKKIKDDEKEKEKKDKPDKGHCFWESVTMTMRQISPTKKLEKMEGWEPPHLENLTETVTDEAPEDKSQKGGLPVSFPDSLAAVRWTARAKVKLAGISRMSRGIVSESAWEGFK
uniref:Uncharacterized protein n=1 Tax=Sander lucioperca TaxID=283035 RepID=A0A8D0ARR4_SANLU